MRIAFKTFGCRANNVDTDVLFVEAQKRGHTVVGENAAADGYVINSCTVTANADKDARFQVSRFRRQNPKALIGVIGCYAQVAKDELLGINNVDFVVGTANKLKILDLFEKSWKENLPLLRDHVENPTGFLTGEFKGSRYARAAVKIQDGCNFKCTFCIIPSARGRSRSLPVTNVLSQISEATRMGYPEVVLTGIHLAHYGWDLGSSLGELLTKIFALPDSPRIRLSTLDPFEIPDDLIALFGVEPRLCPHLHIALQSGSDNILKAMRRIYKAQEFVEVTEKIYRQYPDTFVGVDVIVGFPGETEAEFQKTLNCLNSSHWSKLHVFSYSERAGTEAAAMSGKVNPAIINERSALLRQLSDTRYEAFLKGQIGKQKEIILERSLTEDGEQWLGHTENYLPTLTRISKGATRMKLAATLTEFKGERFDAIPA